jgi:hypothetical protein
MPLRYIKRRSGWVFKIGAHLRERAMTILFDNHHYAKRLQDAGMPTAMADISG